LITRAEIMATFAKAVRMNVIDRLAAEAQIEAFQHDWRKLALIPVNEQLVDFAGVLAWQSNLRGYDAVHLASALLWQDLLQSPITFATFDKRLWQAAKDAGLEPFPSDISSFLTP